ncbi:hypothetical protein ACFZB4_18515 [Streptomyces pseudovenezuelae]|uniref:hypothetical protein n=1 Tax=Streptomyces pseudovenezuelae TaxID=67350 RepID=UPI0036E6AC3C
MPGTVWIVAQVKAVDDEGWATDWDLGGVFTTEEKARSVCTEPTDAMWPAELDEPLGRETTEPPLMIYPADSAKES